MNTSVLRIGFGLLLVVSLAACASPVDTPVDSSSFEPHNVVITDYNIPDDGAGLAGISSAVVLGTFEKTLGQRPAKAVGMGLEGNVDVWQVRVTTAYKGNTGAVVHVMRWPDNVEAGQYHMTAGVVAVLFLAGPVSGLYTTVCGDSGLLFLGDGGKTLTTPGALVPGLETIDQVASLF